MILVLKSTHVIILTQSSCEQAQPFDENLMDQETLSSTLMYSTLIGFSPINRAYSIGVVYLAIMNVPLLSGSREKIS